MNCLKLPNQPWKSFLQQQAKPGNSQDHVIAVTASKDGSAQCK